MESFQRKSNKKRINLVFIISLIITLSIAIFSILENDLFVKISNEIFEFLTKKFAWFYLTVMLFFVLFILFIACSKFGKLKLGANDEKPEHTTFSWFAMLFCAGMGVGLVFWGISEPVAHFINPVDVEAITPKAAEFAFKSVFMHWGIHPWANYAVVGLSLAYFQFRKNKPGLMSVTLEPLIGEKRVNGGIGKVVDILASFATISGVVTSLGLGVLQITSGFNTIFGIPNTLMVQIIIICIITMVFMWSAISGINKGVKILSDLNIILAFVFALLAVFIGPKLEIINNMLNGIGSYIGNFVQDSLSITGYGDNSWTEAWRIFYWAWWIAWAPFVGIFIARISRGRTIREFIIGVVLAPTLASIVWFSIFGTLGIHIGVNNILPLEIMQQVANVPESGLFIILQQYPLATILSLIAIAVLCIFFITSADSGTFVLAMLSSKGNPNPPNILKIIWGIVQALLAIGLLIAGGLKPLQTISIVAAFPFIFVMLAACIALVKSLQKEIIN